MRTYTISFLNNRRPLRSILTPIKIVGDGVGTQVNVMVNCRCECGVEITLSIVKFIEGTLSCGCLKEKYHIPDSNKKSTYPYKLRKAYNAMMRRCYNQNYTGYEYWGGRGVVVCEEWRGHQEVFCEWALKNGWKPGLHLDKDIKGNGMLYSPSTCSFVTRQANYRAKATKEKYMFRGQMLCLAEISEITGVGLKLMFKRVKELGWPIEIAATTPQIKPGTYLYRNKKL